MGTELRNRYEGTAGWVRNNIQIPRGDFVDGDESMGKSLIPTDTFGEINFIGATRKARGKFLRLAQKTSAKTIMELMIDHWELERPKLMISVTGGAKSFNMDPSLSQQFANGLLKVAETPGAWVITGGTNTGVMKHVGEALQGATKACIGIATWGIVQNRNTLIAEENVASKTFGGRFSYNVASSLVETGAFLDHNHTHFLLVDDGSDQKYGREIPLRSSVEEELIQRKVPSVVLVLEGGPGTLGTVKGSLEANVPVVVIKDSGRAADLLVEAIEKCSLEKAKRLVDNLDDADDVIMGLVKDKFPEHLKKSLEDQSREYMKLYTMLVSCLTNQNMITTFQMDSSNTVDEAILAALLKRHSSTHMEQLKFTMLWDRPDLADEKILAKPLKNKEYWKNEELMEAMVIALATDRVDFVKLFLKYGISVSKIVDESVLQFLYGFCMKSQSSLLDREVKNAYVPAVSTGTENSLSRVMESLCEDYGYDVNKCGVSMNKIHEIIENLCSKLRQGTALLTKKSIKEYPFRELFLWAVVNGMHDMALYLWEFEEEGLIKALIAAEINSQFAEKAGRLSNLPDEIQESFKSNALEFQNLALQLLDECYRADEKKALKLITGQSEQFNKHTCLDLAINSDHLDFVSHSSVQALLDDVWTGSIKNTDITSREFILSIVFPPYLLSFDFRKKHELKEMIRTEEEHTSIPLVPSLPGISAKSEDTSSSSEIGNPTDRNGSQSKLVGSTNNKNYKTMRESSVDLSDDDETEMSFLNKAMLFYFETPVVKFYCSFVSYIVFLVLIGVVAMEKKKSKPTAAEYVVIAYVVSFTLEEVHQFFQSEYSSVSAKLMDYLSSKWNLVDILANVLFYVALGLRFNESTSDMGHLILAMDAGVWVLRLLHVFYAHRIMGPYVVMIYRMFVDMLYFFMILLVFMFAYGIVAVSILTPQDRSWKMLSDVVFHPYFNIYGELFLDRDAEDAQSTRFGTPILNNYAETMSIILLALYLLIANVLLLNLLIAIFGNTFSEVQENASQIWKFQRYPLIVEYKKRPPLVPPLILLVHAYMFIKWLIRICTCSKSQAPSGLKSILTEEEREEISEFETDCVAKFVRSRTKDGNADEGKVTDVLDKMKSLQKVMSNMEKRLQEMEKDDKFDLEITD